MTSGIRRNGRFHHCLFFSMSFLLLFVFNDIFLPNYVCKWKLTNMASVCSEWVYIYIGLYLFNFCLVRCPTRYLLCIPVYFLQSNIIIFFIIQTRHSVTWSKWNLIHVHVHEESMSLVRVTCYDVIYKNITTQSVASPRTPHLSMIPIVTFTFELWPLKSIGVTIWLTCLPSLKRKQTTD